MSTNVPQEAHYHANKRRHERQAWIELAKICFELRLKSITVQFNFSGECFLYDSPLLVVEHVLIRSPVAAIFRFRRDTKGPVKRNVELCEYFTQFHQQVFIANNLIDDDFAPRTKARRLRAPRACGNETKLCPTDFAPRKI